MSDAFDTGSGTRRRDAHPTALEQVLARYLGEKGYLRHGGEVLAAVFWPEVVGPWYARHTEVVSVHDGVLTVACDSAPRAQQLQADSATILKRLNARVAQQLQPATADAPPAYLRELRASSAGRRRSSAPAARAPAPSVEGELAALPLTGEEEAEVTRLAAAIPDAELAERFAGALRSRLRLIRWQRLHRWPECPLCGCFYPPDQDRCWVCSPPG